MASSIHFVCAMSLITFGCVDSPGQEPRLGQTASMVQGGPLGAEPPGGLATSESDSASNESAIDDSVVDPAAIALENPPVKQPGRPGIVGEPSGESTGDSNVVALGDPPPHQPSTPGVAETGRRQVGSVSDVVDPTAIVLEEPPVKEWGHPGIVADRQRSAHR